MAKIPSGRYGGFGNIKKIGVGIGTLYGGTKAVKYFKGKKGNKPPEPNHELVAEQLELDRARESAKEDALQLVNRNTNYATNQPDALSDINSPDAQLRPTEGLDLFQDSLAQAGAYADSNRDADLGGIIQAGLNAKGKNSTENAKLIQQQYDNQLKDRELELREQAVQAETAGVFGQLENQQRALQANALGQTIELTNYEQRKFDQEQAYTLLQNAQTLQEAMAIQKLLEQEGTLGIGSVSADQERQLIMQQKQADADSKRKSERRIKATQEIQQGTRNGTNNPRSFYTDR